MLRTQKGFTLVEMIIVIVIIGLLAALAIPKYIRVQSEARARCRFSERLGGRAPGSGCPGQGKVYGRK